MGGGTRPNPASELPPAGIRAEGPVSTADPLTPIFDLLGVRQDIDSGHGA